MELNRGVEYMLYTRLEWTHMGTKAEKKSKTKEKKRSKKWNWSRSH